MLRSIHSRKGVLGLAITGAVLVASASLAPLASADNGRGQVHNWDRAKVESQRGQNRGGDQRGGGRDWNARRDGGTWNGGARGSYSGRSWQGRQNWHGGQYGSRGYWRGGRGWNVRHGWSFGAVIVRPYPYYAVRRPVYVVRPRAYYQPWYVNAPCITVFNQPYYYQASLGVYLGGVALNFDLINGPPPGYVFYDPYCGIESDTLDGYVDHAAYEQHPAAVTLVAVNDDDGDGD